MENKLYRLIFLTVVFFFAVGVQAQKRNARYIEYINKYSDLAVEQMKLHKFRPVSRWRRDCWKAVPDTVSWHERATIILVLSVEVVGGGVPFVTMMMHATNVSVPIAILVILTKIILTSLEEVPVMPFFSNWISQTIRMGPWTEKSWIRHRSVLC